MFLSNSEHYQPQKQRMGKARKLFNSRFSTQKASICGPIYSFLGPWEMYVWDLLFLTGAFVSSSLLPKFILFPFKKLKKIAQTYNSIKTYAMKNWLILSYADLDSTFWNLTLWAVSGTLHWYIDTFAYPCIDYRSCACVCICMYMYGVL